MINRPWQPIAWKPLAASGRIRAVTPIHFVRPADRNLMGDLYTACGLLVPSDLRALRDWRPNPATHKLCLRCQDKVSPV
jgi:hypothetical protein